MFVYSYLFTIVAILVLIYVIIRYKMHRISLSSAIVLSVAMLFMILFSIFPDASGLFAKLLGISRGLDFVFIAAIVVLLFIIAKLYFIIEDLQRNLDEVVKITALNNEVDE